MSSQTPDISTPAPSGSDPVAQTLALIQPWIDYVPRQQRRLGMFIFLAFLAHVAAFFFLRIDTARAELRHQTRTHVTLEYPQAVTQEVAPSEDNFWDRLADPRLFLLPTEPPGRLSSDESTRDFAAIISNLSSDALPPAAPPEDFQFVRSVVTPLEQRVEEAMRPPRQPFTYEEKPPVIAAKTTWQCEDALAARQPAGLPDLPSPISDTELLPTELRVAVGADGTVEHVLVEQSCGSGRLDLDQQAVLAARKIRFQPADKPDLLWGRITVFWHYSATPREEVVPTPTSGP